MVSTIKPLNGSERSKQLLRLCGVVPPTNQNEKTKRPLQHTSCTPTSPSGRKSEIPMKKVCREKGRDLIFIRPQAHSSLASRKPKGNNTSRAVKRRLDFLGSSASPNVRESDHLKRKIREDGAGDRIPIQTEAHPMVIKKPQGSNAFRKVKRQLDFWGSADENSNSVCSAGIPPKESLTLKDKVTSWMQNNDLPGKKSLSTAEDEVFNLETPNLESRMEVADSRKAVDFSEEDIEENVWVDLHIDSFNDRETQVESLTVLAEVPLQNSTSDKGGNEISLGNGESPSRSVLLTQSHINDQELVHVDEPGIRSEAAESNDQALRDVVIEPVIAPQTKRKRINLPKESTRKRTTNPHKWKASVAKSALNSGQAHTSLRGKEIPAAQMKRPCSCRKMCSLKFSEAKREEIFKKFWQLGDHTRQWDFISRHTTHKPVKQRTAGENSRRKFSVSYFFFSNAQIEEKIPVCQVMFLHTLGIGQSWVQSAHKHLASGEGGSLSPDKRGRHANRPHKTSEAQKESVRRHIGLLDRVPSHYVRKRSKREYLEVGRSIKKLAKQYKIWCQKEELPVGSTASARQYRTIFNTEFNIGIFKPKKDQCSLCQIMRKGTRVEREQYKDKWVKHFNNKKKVREIKSKDNKDALKDKSIIVCCFDLQKVLPCPKSETSDFFYRNKLSVYNFTVYNSTQHVGHCYLWHEGIAKRGSNEIASMLFDFISTCASNGVKEVRFYSDSCSGQNKNRFVFAMLALACVYYNIKISLRFLEPGHTQNQCDSMHALIERESHDLEFYDFDEWVKFIEDVKQEEPMYIVNKVNNKMVWDFKKLVSMQNWDKDTEGKKIQWSKVKEVRVDFSTPNIVKFRYTHDGELQSLDLNQRRGHPVNLKTYKPLQAYDSKLPLKPKKIRDLKALCKSLAIPSKYHEKFKSIISIEAREEEVRVDSGEEADASEDEFHALAERVSRERRLRRAERERGENTTGEDQEAETDGEGNSTSEVGE